MKKEFYIKPDLELTKFHFQSPLCQSGVDGPVDYDLIDDFTWVDNEMIAF